MTDDIVTRLRKWANQFGTYEGEQENADDLRQAADEIERLRADLDNVRDMNEKLTEQLQTYYSEDELNADWE